MKQITFTLNEPQAQSLAGLISLGVSGLGAQIAQGGVAALKEGARILNEADGLVDAINAALTKAAEDEAAGKDKSE